MYVLKELRNRFRRLSKPDKLVILRNDHLGDLILTLPLIAQAQDWLGPENVSVVVSSPFDSLFEMLPLSTEVYTDPGGGFRRLGNLIAKTGADTLIAAASKSRNAYAAQYSGLQQRLGFGYKFNAIFYTHPLFVHRKNPPCHEAKFCLEYLKKFKAFEPAPIRLPEHNLDPSLADESLKAHSLTGPFVAVHPGHSGSAHHPSMEQYRRITEYFQERTDVLITNKGEEERQQARKLTEGLKRARPLSEDLSLKTFSALLKKAELFIGGSSGPLHLASLVRTPRVGLYSNDPRFEPAKWKPFGDNQFIFTPPSGDTLNQVKGEMIVETIKNWTDRNNII